MGSGQVKTGLRTQSDARPGAWLVLDPSKPQIGRSSGELRILVLERRSGEGSVPSIQMYSALVVTSRQFVRAVFPTVSGSVNSV